GVLRVVGSVPDPGGSEQGEPIDASNRSLRTIVVRPSGKGARGLFLPRSTTMKFRPIAAARITFALLLGLVASPAVAQTDYFTVTPCRLYDSRLVPPFAPLTPLSGTPTLQITGACGIPPGASAAALNLTAVHPTTFGHITTYPSGTPVPLVSSLNFNAGVIRSGNVVVALSPGGAVDFKLVFANGGSLDLVVDVVGYYRAPDAPEVTTTAGTTGFTEDLGAVVVDAGVTVTDPDDTDLQSATVSLMSAPDGAAEVLNATNCGSLVVAPGNPLAISGTAAVGVYETCLQSVTYNNTSQNPNTANRTVNFVVNDGTNNSNTGMKTVSVTAVNDAPTITSSATPSVPENQTAVIDVQSTDAED